MEYIYSHYVVDPSYVCVYTYTCICTHRYIYMYTGTHMCIYVYIYIYEHIYEFSWCPPPAPSTRGVSSLLRGGCISSFPLASWSGEGFKACCPAMLPSGICLPVSAGSDLLSAPHWLLLTSFSLITSSAPGEACSTQAWGLTLPGCSGAIAKWYTVAWAMDGWHPPWLHSWGRGVWLASWAWSMGCRKAEPLWLLTWRSSLGSDGPIPPWTNYPSLPPVLFLSLHTILLPEAC